MYPQDVSSGLQVDDGGGLVRMIVAHLRRTWQTQTEERTDLTGPGVCGKLVGAVIVIGPQFLHTAVY